MKRPSRAAIAALFIIAITPTLRAQTAAELIKDHTTKAIAALEAYLKENPEATDRGAAIDFLIEAYGQLGEKDHQVQYLEKKYAMLPKGAQLDQQKFFSVYQPLFAMRFSSGDRDAARAVMARAKTDIEGHSQSVRLAAVIDQIGAGLNKPIVGEPMTLKFKSMAGDEIDLVTMTGKVVLVDFWATWSKPCVAEIPNVKETYNKLHDRGFEVIGVSFDTAKTEKKLKNYIAEHELPWPQAFDGRGREAPLAKSVGVSSVPANFLIGKDGKVAATNLRGPALGKAVRKELAK